MTQQPGISTSGLITNLTDSNETPKATDTPCLLPRRAVQRGGWAAGEVLLDALVVPDLRGHWDGGGLSSGGHHRGLP